MTEDLTQTVDIETPELVVVSYTIAGLGSRVSAGLIDLVICILGLIAVVTGIALMAPDGDQADGTMSGAVAIAILVVADALAHCVDGSGLHRLYQYGRQPRGLAGELFHGAAENPWIHG